MTLSYQKRNILILLAFVIIIVTVGGYFLFYLYPGKIKKFKKEQQAVEKEINNLATVELEHNEVIEKIKIEQTKFAKLDKQIIDKVPSARTYAYLNSIIKYIGPLKFDLSFLRTENRSGYGYSIYRITGEGAFATIYQFIWCLERGPEIYRIYSLNMQGLEKRDEDGKMNFNVTYSFELRAFFADVKDLPVIDNKLSDTRLSFVEKNPFYPGILKDVEPNTEALVEVDRSELKAVIPGKAYLVDQTGRTKTLKVGDPVYLGRTSLIDPKRNQVIFTLNKGGLIEKFVLTLKFDTRTEQ